MKQRLPQNAVEGVDASTWRRLGVLLMQHRGKGLMPHEMANRIGVHRHAVMAMTIVLGRRNLVTRRYCIYHRCSEAPVDYRDFEDGFQPTLQRSGRMTHLRSGKATPLGSGTNRGVSETG